MKSGYTFSEPFPREALRQAYAWHKATTTCLNGRDYTEAEWLRVMVSVWDRPGARSWGCYAEDGSLVGLIFFEPIWRGGELVDGSVHISLARSVWGQGVIDSAAEEIIPALFATPSILRLSGFTPSHYRPGLAVATRLGFLREGEITDAVTIQGRIRNITMTGLTRQRWQEGRDSNGRTQ